MDSNDSNTSINLWGESQVECVKREKMIDAYNSKFHQFLMEFYLFWISWIWRDVGVSVRQWQHHEMKPTWGDMTDHEFTWSVAIQRTLWTKNCKIGRNAMFPYCFYRVHCRCWEWEINHGGRAWIGLWAEHLWQRQAGVGVGHGGLMLCDVMMWLACYWEMLLSIHSLQVL